MELFDFEESNKSSIIPYLNEFIVFDAICKKEPISINELIKITKISKPTVLICINKLANKKLIYTAGMGKSRGGRKPKLYGFNDKYKFVIGIEIEIPNIRMGITDLRGKVVTQDKIQLNSLSLPRKSIFEEFEKIIESLIELIKDSNIPRDKFLGIGVGVTGFFDKKRGISLFSPRISGWRDIPVKDILEKKLGLPVFLESEANILTLGELVTRQYFPKHNLAYIVFGYGLGAGLLINKKLYQGKLGNTGVLGHTIIEPNGLKCVCGNRGCLEMYASEKVIISKIKAGIEKIKNPELKGRLNDNITFNDILEFTLAGDKFCNKVVFEALDYLSIGIANLVNLFEINEIILGGSLALSHSRFDSSEILDYVSDSTKNYLLPPLKDQIKFSFGSVERDKAAIVGAAYLILDKFFSKPSLSKILP